MLLTEKIKIARTFQQSARIDTDLETSEALDGFIFHDSAKYALQRMAQMIVESNRRGIYLHGALWCRQIKPSIGSMRFPH